MEQGVIPLEQITRSSGKSSVQNLEQSGPPSAPLRELHVLVAPDASFKVGTCEHCVLEEVGRPERAWDAKGDQELDFDRETYFACLAELGVVIREREAYVCP